MSGLHIIILDEIDAICKARGSVAGSTAVHDTVVNQLLSKIDGVEEINNILIIGMTNRKDMIDEALLRPGRLEVQMEISLPNEHGRVQILNIHTSKLKENGKLGEDVNISELAQKTKNFSGAELAGLVQARLYRYEQIHQGCASIEIERGSVTVWASTKIELETDAVEKLKVTSEDFMAALQDIKPAFGSSEESLEPLMTNGIQEWGDPVHEVFKYSQVLLREARNSDETPLVSVLIEGPPQSGKTALAAKIALDSQFPFTRVCTPEKMIGFTENITWTTLCCNLHIIRVNIAAGV
ncbi:hypothetical protein EB796_020477 [Bugula neritina]|uniref:Vesicle-fusing ATPase n=1 Tax=Bugula neritina TaxID=10212 RepID=A0A7J7J717_BUGNE|nr:hypothetical protein EB796_020477 [Bugula neritina]